MSRNRTTTEDYIDDTTVVATVTGKPFVSKPDQRMSVQCIWTGTLDGTLTLEASNDNGTTWSPVAAADADLLTISPDASAGNGIIGFINCVGGLQRIVFTFSAGSGDLKVHLCQS